MKSFVDENNIIPSAITLANLPDMYSVKKYIYSLSVIYGRCHSNDSMNIFYHLSNGVILPSADTIPGGTRQEVVPIIGGTGSYIKYLWTGIDKKYVLGGSDTLRNLIVDLTKNNTTIYFYGVTPDSCFESDSTVLRLAPVVKPANGFTPNGDGRNDKWIIEKADVYSNSLGTSVNVEVFNRWGQKIYSQKGYNNDDKAWDGKYNGNGLSYRHLLLHYHNTRF